MGNYHVLEKDFIERTISLIDQYHDSLEQYPFEKQFNYTLTINCLLGLIVMPKERVITFVQTDRLTSDFKKKIGLQHSIIGEQITTLKELIVSLRHAVAHFDIVVTSETKKRLIDWVEFKDSKNGNRSVAKFHSKELLPFLKYYAKCLIENLTAHRNRN